MVKETRASRIFTKGFQLAKRGEISRVLGGVPKADVESRLKKQLKIARLKSKLSRLRERERKFQPSIQREQLPEVRRFDEIFSSFSNKNPASNVPANLEREVMGVSREPAKIANQLDSGATFGNVFDNMEAQIQRVSSAPNKRVVKNIKDEADFFANLIP